MTDAGYVLLGYGVTAGAIGTYVVRLLARSRRARRALPAEDATWR